MGGKIYLGTKKPKHFFDLKKGIFKKKIVFPPKNFFTHCKEYGGRGGIFFFNKYLKYWISHGPKFFFQDFKKKKKGRILKKSPPKNFFFP